MSRNITDNPQSNGGCFKRRAGFITESSVSERDRRKVALPIIPIEHVRLAIFFMTKRSTLLVGDDLPGKAIRQIRVCQRTPTNADKVGLPIDHSKIEPRIRLIPQRRRPIVRDIKIQVAISFNIANGHRHPGAIGDSESVRKV